MTKTSQIMAVVVIILIICGLIVIGNKLVEDIAEISKMDVDVRIQLSGDDIIVTVYGGTDLPRVTHIRVRIEGIPETSPLIDCARFATGEPVVCKNLAADVTGHAFVIVEGILSDTSTAPLYHSRISFT